MLLTLVLLTQTKILWQIGTPDGKPTGLGLDPGGYSQYSADPLYIVGQSQTRDWPYVLPGPHDIWAGSKNHRGDIAFGLQGASKTGTFQLNIDLADSHSISPPNLILVVNGKQIASWQASKGKDDNLIEGKSGPGKPSRWQTKIPATAFINGNNTLSISSTRGSWIVFDAITLQAPANVKTVPIKDQLAVSILPSKQAILRTAKGHRQPIECEILNYGSARKAQLTCGKVTETVDLQPGRQTIQFNIDPVKKQQKVEVRIQSGKLKTSATHTVRPVRPWVIYLFPHSHVDIGYTDLQDRVLQMHQRNFTDAIAVAKENNANPSDSKFRFNVEATWVLDRYMLTGTAAQKAAVISALKDKSLFLSAGYANLLTGVMHPEEMMQSLRYSQILGNQYGFKTDTVTQTDVPGVSWGYVSALHESGIRNLVLMPNAGDRVGRTLSTWGDKPFWWTGPSGTERILVWQTDPYSVGVSAGWNGDRSKPLRSDDPSSRFIDSFIFNKLQRLTDQNYPYDILGEPWSVQDNAPIDADVPIAAKLWNEKYVYPKVVIATVDQACEELRKKYGTKLPLIKGDYTPYWEDGVGSTAAETSMNRTTPHRLIQAETLFAMNAPSAYPKETFLEAWRNSILFSEHTWGAWNSVSNPDDATVKAEWAIKRGFAETADKLSRQLLEKSLGQPNSTIEVRNTNSWPRTDLVRLSPAQSLAGDRVLDMHGKPLPSQRLQTGELAVLVQNVPPLGAIRLKVTSGNAHIASTTAATKLDLKNDQYALRLDPKTGAIASIKTLNRELVKQPLNAYLYLPGTNLKDLKSNEQPNFQVIEPGPLVATIRATSNAPGTKSLTQEITLVAGLDQIQITNILDKLAVREKEGVHFAFPFSIPNGKMRIDLQWSVIEPEKQQIAGANKNWLTSQSYVDISNQDFGVTWSTLDAPLIEVGEISGNLLGSVPLNEWRKTISPTQTLYSWALNNHWHTNYKADQDGKLIFRYALQAHRGFKPDKAKKFGTELKEPLIVTSAPGKTESLFTISDPTILATRTTPSDDDKAIIVRLFNTAAQIKRVRLKLRRDLASISRTNNNQKATKSITGSIEIPPNGIVTLRIERKT